MSSKNIKIYTQPNCHYCVLAKKLLKTKGYFITEVVIGLEISKESFFSAFPNIKTVPAIFIDDDIYIGGYVDLLEFLRINADI